MERDAQQYDSLSETGFPILLMRAAVFIEDTQMVTKRKSKKALEHSKALNSSKTIIVSMMWKS